MLLTTLTPILLTGLVPATLAVAQEEAPPGLVKIKGGRTYLGTAVKEIEPLIFENEGLAGELAGETPRVQVKVDDFYLMPTEVTNEQYAEYVRATGAKPPWTWGEAALNEGLKAYLEDQGRKAKEAREAGERFDRKPFDKEAWWEKNWEESPWEVPTNLLDRPVAYVNYYDVWEYSRWAGLRPATEAELVRAMRGDKDSMYPWGDDWKDKCCASLEAGQDSTWPSGSFPDGATNGVFDLLGNVWEWTSSPYVKFDGYKKLTLKVGKGSQARKIDALAPFDPNFRVTLGGSYSVPKLAQRCGVRHGAERIQSTDALGFRCAATANPGVDLAEALLKDDIKLNVLSDEVEFHTPSTTIRQRWHSRESTADGLGDRVSTYRVITGHEYITFVPAKEAPGNTVKSLKDKSNETGPVTMGFLSTSKAILEPALGPGTYFVAYRGAGKLPKVEAVEDEEGEDAVAVPMAAGTPFHEAPGFDETKDMFVISDLEGSALAAFPAQGMLHDRMNREGSIQYTEFVMPEELDPDVEPPTPMDTLTFKVLVASKAKSKGYVFDLPLKVEPGKFDW